MIGKLINYNQIPRHALVANGGSRSSGSMLCTADYKGGGALKSCRTEFYHNL